MKRALLAALVLSVGCSTALSSMQPAEVLKKRQKHAAVGSGLNLAPGPIVDIVGVGLELADEPALNEEQEQELLTASLALALNPPGVQSEYAFRYGFGYNLDAGLRYTVNAIQGDVKYQFLGTPESPGAWNGSVSVGYSRHLFKGSIFDVLDSLQVNDFSRSDVYASVMFGRHPREFFQYWGGPKVIAGFYEVTSLLETTGTVDQSQGNMLYLGGSLGAALGWKYLWLVGELSAANLIFNADVLGQERDLGGLVLYPTVGVMTRF